MLSDKSRRLWYLRTDEGEEGPLSFYELRRHPLVTPDCWLRRIDSEEWCRARYIVELQELFEDEDLNKQKAKDEGDIDFSTSSIPSDELTLDLTPEPSPLLWCLLFAAIVLGYAYYILWYGHRS